MRPVIATASITILANLFPAVPCNGCAKAGVFLEERTALQAMKVAAEVLAYFSRENITHNLLSENAVFIDPNNRPRIANIAAHEVTKRFGVAEEMQELGRMIAGVVSETSQALGVGKLREVPGLRRNGCISGLECAFAKAHRDGTNLCSRRRL